MRAYKLILDGVDLKTIATYVAEPALLASSAPTSAKYFLWLVTDAIYFDYQPSDDEVFNMHFEWPSQKAVKYTFIVIPAQFKKYLTVLELTGSMMRRSRHSNAFIKIVQIFLAFYDAMNESWELNFREPLALTSVSLLKVIHSIRKASKTNHESLSEICQKLFNNSEKGLGFQYAHSLILNDICPLLEAEYDRFTNCNINIFEFYFTSLKFEDINQRTRTFYSLSRVIKKHGNSPAFKEDLRTFLTNSNAIKICCFFANQPFSKLTVAVLTFLKSLLILPSIEEDFSREQVHTILLNALYGNRTAQNLAVSFYVTFMEKRSFTKQLIFRDIIDFFISEAVNLDNLDNVIGLFWEAFPYLTYFGPYLKLLQRTNLNDCALCVTAQFVYRVFVKLYRQCENNELYASRLNYFLINMPALLEMLEDKWEVRGILLQIYSSLELDKAIHVIKDLPIAMEGFNIYAKETIERNEESYIIVQNTTHQMLTFLEFLHMYDDIRSLAVNHYSRCKTLMAKAPQLNESQAKELEKCLLIISVILRTSYNLHNELVVSILHNLCGQLFGSNSFQQLSTAFNCLIEPFAIEAFSGCLTYVATILTQISSLDIQTELSEYVNQLVNFLMRRLKDESLRPAGLEFIKAATCALCKTLIMFNLKLEADIYHTIVAAVCAYVFDLPRSQDYMRQEELQQDIFVSFNALHKHVKIPTTSAWKVLIHYGETAAFENKLTELLDALFEHNSDKYTKPALFTAVVPSAIYNAFLRHTDVQQFSKVLQAFKKYIDSIHPVKQRLIKVHIIMSILYLIEKVVRNHLCWSHSNRLQILSHMNALFTDIYSNESKMIIRQAKILELYNLSRYEQVTLEDFTRQFSV